ncbi:MAG: transcriptional repressor [Proteobacteria bacterium]|nr:transcriptional repressor [Pseudomonadota bacterium]
MEPEIEIFREHLGKKGLRNTKERDAIVREISAFHDHFDVDQLYLLIKKKKGVSKASIYRTIPLLIEAGLITEVYLEDGHMHYERTLGRDHHCHLRCNQCRTIIEFSDPRLQEIEREVAQKVGFVPDGHKLEITGLCPQCAALDKRRPGA